MVAAMNFGNLVAVLAVAAAVPLILAAVPRVRVPGPVLEIVAGIVLGPAVLDLVKPDQAVRLVSTIGLAFLLFLAGLEVDVRHFRGPRARLAGEALGLSALLALTIAVLDAIERLADDPRPTGSFPYGSPDLRRLRVGRYRVLYEVTEEAVAVRHIARGTAS
jgi:plasmid stabilization system protein ParE